MKKLLILSGKGGTGKTTTAAAFLHFSQARAMADCDVDAPNLHIVTQMTGQPVCTDFLGGDKAAIDPETCVGCGTCQTHCRFGAIRQEKGQFRVLERACEGCGVCTQVCPAGAVSMHTSVAGELRRYDGERVFSTAQLKMGCGNSGMLVTQVKQNMLQHAPETELAIIDGSPGIGCPVIASITGVDLVLIVSEPTLSGLSDLERIVRTAQTLRTRLAVCVNKYDTCPEKAQAIEDYCRTAEIAFAGRIPYDPSASAAINAGKSVAESNGPAAQALRQVYQKVMEMLSIAAQ